MKRTYSLLLSTPLVCLLLAFVYVGTASAAAREITMTPTSASPVIAPDKTFTDSLQVINNGQSGYAYSIYSMPYSVKGEDYSPRFTLAPDSVDASKWFSFSLTSGQSSPGQVATVSYTIHVPDGTPPGGYYATVFAQTAGSPSNTSGVELSQRVGEIFYIQVAGPVTQGGTVLSWSSPLLQQAPVIATTRLQNTGDLHYAATLAVTVKDVLGHTKYTYDTTRQVLPQTTRQIPVTWSGAPAFGLFKVTGDASYLDKRTPLTTKWVLVMAMPIRLVLAGLLLLAVIFFTKAKLFKWGRHGKKA